MRNVLCLKPMFDFQLFQFIIFEYNSKSAFPPLFIFKIFRPFFAPYLRHFFQCHTIFLKATVIRWYTMVVPTRAKSVFGNVYVYHTQIGVIAS